MDYFLTEVSFEAGNKVGGIWTVLTSKSSKIKDTFGTDYLAIGFYNPTQAAIEFIESDPPDLIKDALAAVKLEGVEFHFGRWVSANDVNLLLIDSSSFKDMHVNEIKKSFWEKFGIDSLNAPDDYNTPLAWSYVAGAVVASLSNKLNKKIVCQVHEWLSGGTVLYLKSNGIKVPTVFTVHATVLGRAMANAGIDTLEFVNSNTTIDQSLAYKYWVAAKHLTEKASAKESNVFTAVSDIVAKEAELILERKADVITLNGLDKDDLPDVDGLTEMRSSALTKFYNFITSYFLPYYDFSPKSVPIFFTSGRYEFFNKGFDLFIDALGKLDKMMPENKSVIAMITVPAGTVGLKNEVVANYITYMSIKSSLDADLKNFDRVVSSYDFTSQTSLEKVYSKIVNDSRMVITQLRRPKPTFPPLCPFRLSYPEETDSIINKLQDNGLINAPSNHVKVIFYPKYLTVGEELLNLTYNELIAVSTAGFFLSRYEPFGYTPIEAAAFLSIPFTTDHSGFGVCLHNLKLAENGVFVEGLLNVERESAVNNIADDMLRLVTMDDDNILDLKLKAREVAEVFDWEHLISTYFRAYETALGKV